MFGIKKDKKKSADSAKGGIFARLRDGLKRTRASLGGELTKLISGKPSLDGELIEAIEERLLLADVGVEATEWLIEDLKQAYASGQKLAGDDLIAFIQNHLQSILAPCEQAVDFDSHSPTVVLFVGINGSGKTTTIGKLAKILQDSGKSVLLAAGDTFRAAAIEQLQVWGERNDIPVVAQQTGSDSASVIYDAINSAKARNIDVVLADTAGRLHTQGNLMEELKKVKRVCQKFDDNMPHEVMLVLDAGIGQNAIVQTEQFQQAVDVSGICLTKLDGTAKGGVIFAIAKKFQIPIRYIGIGEGINDCREFVAANFVKALFGENVD